MRSIGDVGALAVRMLLPQCGGRYGSERGEDAAERISLNRVQQSVACATLLMRGLPPVRYTPGRAVLSAPGEAVEARRG